MTAKRLLLVVLVASIIMLAVAIGPGARARPPAQEPNPAGATIPYAGHLSDDAGQPVADGPYDLTFALYDGPAGGDLLWSEVQGGVRVQDGAFVTMLGGGNGIPRDVLDGGERWLGVAVRGPGEAGFTALAPRQRLSAASPAAPASPNVSAACPHDHWGEVWNGTVMGLHLNSTDSLAKATLSSNDQGVYGLGGNVGVLGEAIGESSDTYGVFGLSTNGYGVYASSTNHYGVRGVTDGDWSYRSGVRGDATYPHANGVTGWNYGPGPGVYGHSETGYAGYFDGPIHTGGRLSEASGGFKIDHPLDPENQYLTHSFVESPDMKNVYDGVVVLDADGEAWVELPAWFQSLNQDFRYQLTPIGAPSPNLYIAQEIQNNRFQIAGGPPGLKVSWQVTGIRHDPYAQAHPSPAEADKPAEEQGTYLHPVEYGQPETSGLDYQRGLDPQAGGEP